MSKFQPQTRIGQGWTNGNHWATAHRCVRCGCTEYRLYDAEDGSEGNLQCVSAPEGWNTLGHALLCPSCYDSFRRWMAEGRKDNELD